MIFDQFSGGQKVAKNDEKWPKMAKNRPFLTKNLKNRPPKSPSCFFHKGFLGTPFWPKNEKILQGILHKTVIFLIKREIYYGKFLAKTFFKKTVRLENPRNRKNFLSGKIVEKMINF